MRLTASRTWASIERRVVFARIRLQILPVGVDERDLQRR